MKIAHVTDFYLPRLGGIEMQVRDLAIRQARAGHTVEVITSSPRPKGQRVSGGEELRVHRLTEKSIFPAALNPAGLRPGRDLLRKGGYDVVHVQAAPFSPLAFSAVALASDAGLPTVLTLHSLISYLETPFRLLDGLVDWSSQPVTWTAVSDVAAEPLHRLVAPAPVHILPNGIDPTRWRVEPLPRDAEEVVVVAVMRLARRKRPLHLLRTLREARAALKPSVRMKVVVVGEGPERPRMERYMRRHGMTGWVSLPGRLPRQEIRTLFRRADVFVAPATLESFGIAALEARCAGIPVVARAEGGVGGFVDDGLGGILASSDTAMAEAITLLAADPGLRTSMAAHNRAVQPPMDWPAVLERTHRIYEIAAGRPSHVISKAVR
ncbi:glycosyltransferase family 4 protein [Actinocorallia longicatena]|uniref:Glycosyltransferase family 4 protein n=1 Tax=Actinocorallia longicatena TaxID=111803 RepID=A0ABP6PVS0_9ACTN